MQTFTNFEVIVVDDCSTDESVAIVKEYVPKFGGRLKLTKTEKNSGGGAQPRNIGLSMASGEYVYFMDADDFILLNALETLYNAAKEYQAEVVYMGYRYSLKAPNDVYLVEDGESRDLRRAGLEDAPMLIGGNNENLLRQTLLGYYMHEAFMHFVRRDFLLENKIVFPAITIGEDFIWTVSVYAHVKRFLRLPKPFYFYQFYNENSVMHNKLASHWAKGLAGLIKALDKSISEIDFLKRNTDICYQVLKGQFNYLITHAIDCQSRLNAQELYDALYKNLIDADSKVSVFLPLFASMSLENRIAVENLTRDLKIAREALANFTARIDVKLMTTEGDFQIISVSDEKATIERPRWFQGGGIGYSIRSFKGTLTITAKATVDGKIKLSLRGIWFPTPEDRNKLIPYWVDYTKLIVNGNTIFDTLTPTWHNKPYIYTFDAKAGEEIKIQVEWLPHTEGESL